MRCRFLTLAVLGAVLFASAGRAADPVEALRSVLKGSTDDLRQRDRDLRNLLGRLATLGDLRRALLLAEWRDEDLDPAILAVDRPLRDEALRRFSDGVRLILRDGELGSQLAVVSMLGEIGPTVPTPGGRDSLARRFAPDLALLGTHREPALREAAARALGQILADPSAALPLFATLLRSPEPGQRHAALVGVATWLDTAWRLTTRPAQPNAVAFPRADLVRAGVLMVPLLGRQLSDQAATVRGKAAATLADLCAALGQVQGQAAVELEPLARVAREQESLLTRAATAGGEPAAAAARALVELAQIPALTGPAAVQTTSLRTPGPEARLPELMTALSDPNVQTRRRALEVLESLGVAAAPAASALVRSLTDPDPFVRWAAVRTLGKLGPQPADGAVALTAGLLRDADLDVRLAAAEALAAYGEAARSAGPLLLEAMQATDADVRLAALRAMASVRPTGPEVVPSITAQLTSPDARVRGQAAHTLGAYGPVALAAGGALRTALADPEESVRQAAGDALLRLQQR